MLNILVDLAITVCDSAAREICLAYLRPIPKAHWGTADPGHVKGSDEAVLAACENTYRIFEQRINKMLLFRWKTYPLKRLPTN